MIMRARCISYGEHISHYKRGLIGSLRSCALDGLVMASILVIIHEALLKPAIASARCISHGEHISYYQGGLTEAYHHARSMYY